MTKHSSVKILICALLIAICVFSLPTLSASVCYAQDLGGVDTATLWQYQQNALNVNDAKAIVDGWNKSLLGNKIVIAVIDTGIDANHELFVDTLLKNDNGDVIGYNVLTPQSATMDISDVSSKHGTGVAGVLAMLIKEFGLEDYIKIYPIKANTPDKDSFLIANLAKAVEQAHNMGADIINLSLGIEDDDYKKVAKTDRSAFEYAIEHAREDVLMVCASGNAGSDCATDEGKFYPATWDSTIGVMSYGKNGNVYGTSNYGNEYDVCAPGEDIYTAYGTLPNSLYKEKTGTSLATPAVSFAGALLKLRYRAEGKGEIDAPTLTKMLRNLEGQTAYKGSKGFDALNLANLLTQDFENTTYEYDVPTAISLVHNGKHGTGDYADAIVRRASDTDILSFVAKLSPQGKVDPALENAITWTLSLLDFNGEVVSTTTLDAKGAKLDWLPSRGGDFLLTANLSLYNLEASQNIHIEYLPYYVGEVRVTYASDAKLGVDNARKNGVLYTNSTTQFALTGVEYVNPDVETKWFVNGEYVASGTEFNFRPQKAGTYNITAQYGDNAKVDFDYKFVADVKPFILRPFDLSMLVVGVAIVVAGTVAFAVVLTKKKKAGAAK